MINRLERHLARMTRFDRTRKMTRSIYLGAALTGAMLISGCEIENNPNIDETVQMSCEQVENECARCHIDPNQRQDIHYFVNQNNSNNNLGTNSGEQNNHSHGSGINPFIWYYLGRSSATSPSYNSSRSQFSNNTGGIRSSSPNYSGKSNPSSPSVRGGFGSTGRSVFTPVGS